MSEHEAVVPPQLCTHDAAADCETYNHRSQLDSLKETMATKLGVADVKGQIAETGCSGQLVVQGKDIQVLKDGVQEIL
jgi:hypothetical protein